jgi:hypothetical protein
VELPLSVEEAMRLLVSGGVLMPTKESRPRTAAAAQRDEPGTTATAPPLAAPAEGPAAS